MGFEVLHGIVDSLWARKDGAADEDYRKLAERIEEELGLPISYEGRYKWIAFLPSKINPEKPVNNRYFGVFTDGRIKFRGIEARRRDTPRIVKDMQLEVLRKLAEANTPQELYEKAGQCLQIYRRYVRRILLGEVSPEELSITRVLSMRPSEYLAATRQAVAAKILESAGLRIQPGQAITYVATKSGAFPIQLLSENHYDVYTYVNALRKAINTILAIIIQQAQ